MKGAVFTYYPDDRKRETCLSDDMNNFIRDVVCLKGVHRVERSSTGVTAIFCYFDLLAMRNDVPSCVIYIYPEGTGVYQEALKVMTDKMEMEDLK